MDGYEPAARSGAPPESGHGLPGSGEFDVVVIGASAGGLTPLRAIVGGLAASFPAAVAVVLHRVPTARSALSEILARDSPLQVEDASPGTVLSSGRIVVARPDLNLMLRADGAVELTAGVRNYVRSAIDPVMESAAAIYGPRAVAVILSGSGRDGTEGARAVHEAGGFVVVQDPATAETGDMPAAVLRAGAADLSLPADEIARVLTALVERGRGAAVTWSG